MEVVGEGVAHLNVSEGVGVKVVGEGVAHPPVSVREQRQVKEISPPGLCSALEKLAQRNPRNVVIAPNKKLVRHKAHIVIRRQLPTTFYTTPHCAQNKSANSIV